MFEFHSCHWLLPKLKKIIYSYDLNLFGCRHYKCLLTHARHQILGVLMCEVSPTLLGSVVFVSIKKEI